MSSKAKAPRAAVRSTRFAEGGGADRMFGEKDRTITGPGDAAGPQAPGTTAHKVTGGRQKFARGGKGRAHAGGSSEPAKPA